MSTPTQSQQARQQAAAADAELRAAVQRRLLHLPQIDGGRVQVDVRRGVVTLHGNVRSWTERQMVETLAWGPAGVTQVVNRLDVAQQPTA